MSFIQSFIILDIYPHLLRSRNSPKAFKTWMPLSESTELAMKGAIRGDTEIFPPPIEEVYNQFEKEKIERIHETIGIPGTGL